MAQKLILTNSDKQRALNAFKSLLNKPSNDPQITFKYNLADITIDLKHRPVIKFTDQAYLKSKALVDKAPGEVGWLGSVTREGNTFTINDLFVYPQTVTSAHIEVDEAEYLKWSMKQNINVLRFQAHSHVNMGTSPSGDDMNTYRQYLQQLDNQDFFIFMIFNKKGDYTCILYDKKNNLKYSTKEIQFIFGTTPKYDAWAKDELEQQCKKFIYTPPAHTNKIYSGSLLDEMEELENDYMRRIEKEDDEFLSKYRRNHKI